MSKYKYVTPYWKDSLGIFGEGHKAHTGTTFYVHNYNNTSARIVIHFYDLDGKLFSDMEVDLLTPPNSVLDMRIVDIISVKNPSYNVTEHSRNGSMHIFCDVPLVISGKMYKGRTNSFGTQDENVWSIPFQEVKMEELNLGRIDDEIPINNPDFSNFFKRRKLRNK
ncbi:hypothetical protein [Flavobacterium channae]|uniref:hypothetical protein n=1 Tax=Flavobacterium channae TaxID=2897181 RepID=UPI001E3E214D|nr:hypothetical protein [Flavobacterium channae]UGS23396.1 hypothetical protein LOS89_11635 [Flavobacterium channae]